MSNSLPGKFKNRFFFREGEEDCYTIQAHLQYMVENHIEEMPIWLAKRETGSDYFFCKHYHEIGERNGTCGKTCEAYKPRNGRSGLCHHYGYTYELTDTSYTLKIDSILLENAEPGSSAAEVFNCGLLTNKYK